MFEFFAKEQQPRKAAGWATPSGTPTTDSGGHGPSGYLFSFSRNSQLMTRNSSTSDVSPHDVLLRPRTFPNNRTLGSPTRVGAVE